MRDIDLMEHELAASFPLHDVVTNVRAAEQRAEELDWSADHIITMAATHLIESGRADAQQAALDLFRFEAWANPSYETVLGFSVLGKDTLGESLDDQAAAAAIYSIAGDHLLMLAGDANYEPTGELIAAFGEVEGRAEEVGHHGVFTKIAHKIAPQLLESAEVAFQSDDSQGVEIDYVASGLSVLAFALMEVNLDLATRANDLIPDEMPWYRIDLSEITPEPNLLVEGSEAELEELFSAIYSDDWSTRTAANRTFEDLTERTVAQLDTMNNVDQIELASLALSRIKTARPDHFNRTGEGVRYIDSYIGAGLGKLIGLAGDLQAISGLLEDGQTAYQSIFTFTTIATELGRTNNIEVFDAMLEQGTGFSEEFKQTLTSYFDRAEKA